MRMERKQLLRGTQEFSLRRQATVAEVSVILEAVRETEQHFCAEVYVGKNAKKWWIWAISLFKIAFVDGIPENQCLATICTELAPFNIAFDRNAGIGQPPVILLKRGKRQKTYKTLSGLYADAADIIGANTPIDLHIHGDASEVGNDKKTVS